MEKITMLSRNTFSDQLSDKIVRVLREIQLLHAVKSPSRTDADFSWSADPDAAGYNLWYVTLKTDVPRARQATAPPAVAVARCAVPSQAAGTTCSDPGAVSRGTPATFFYQVHTYCDATTEGP